MGINKLICLNEIISQELKTIIKIVLFKKYTKTIIDDFLNFIIYFYFSYVKKYLVLLKSLNIYFTNYKFFLIVVVYGQYR